MEGSHPPRRLSVHQALGGGSVADVLLWRRWFRGSMMLVVATMIWLLLESEDCNFLTHVADFLLHLVVILFIWAKSASLLNRPLPPVPNLEISEKSVAKATNVLLPVISYVLSIAQDITVNHNWKLFIQVSCVLCAVSYVGGLVSFVSLGYIGIILSLSVPFFYEKYQDRVDEKLWIMYRFVQTHYRKIEDIMKTPPSACKGKKIE